MEYKRDMGSSYSVGIAVTVFLHTREQAGQSILGWSRPSGRKLRHWRDEDRIEQTSDLARDRAAVRSAARVALVAV